MGSFPKRRKAASGKRKVVYFRVYRNTEKSEDALDMITILQENRPEFSFEGASDRSLLALLQEQGVFVDAPCGGNRKCGKCKVIAAGSLSPLSPEEKEMLSPEELAQGVRLACCTFVTGDTQVRLISAGGLRIQTQGAGEMGELRLRFV